MTQGLIELEIDPVQYETVKRQLSELYELADKTSERIESAAQTMSTVFEEFTVEEIENIIGYILFPQRHVEIQRQLVCQLRRHSTLLERFIETHHHTAHVAAMGGELIHAGDGVGESIGFLAFVHRFLQNRSENIIMNKISSPSKKEGAGVGS